MGARPGAAVPTCPAVRPQARAVVLPKALPPARMHCRGCAALEAGVTRPSALPAQPDGVCVSGTPPPPADGRGSGAFSPFDGITFWGRI